MKMKKMSFVAACLLGSAACADVRTVEMLPSEQWWGVMNYYGAEMPFDAATDLTMDVRADNNSNQSASFLVSDRGRFLWCDRQTKVTVRGGRITMASDAAEVVLDESGKTLQDAYLKAMARHFPPSGKTPDLLFFSAPQYNTWIELTYHQNEKDILAYAQSMMDNGLPPGVLMIDDTWQFAYGTWEFDPRRFSDPKGLVRKLHEMGFKVMLWMCPWVSMDSPEFRRIQWARNPDDVKGWPTKGGFLMDKGRPAAVPWWNGYSALLDFTHPNAVAWFSEQLDRLVRDYGVDGFKFDGGSVKYYAQGYGCHDPKATSADQSTAYARFALRYPDCEYRNCFRFQNQPVVERLHDKPHKWEALRKLVPDMIAGGLLGHPFMCPDMVGGGEWTTFLPGAPFDPDLFVRSAEVHALCGMMQFSASPWRCLDAERQQIVRDIVKMRQEKFAAFFVKLAEEAARTGEPMIRNLEYNYPHAGYAKVKDEFMMGTTLLVAPVLEKGATRRKVVLPPGRWRADDGRAYVGPATIDVEAPLSRLPHFVAEPDKADIAREIQDWEVQTGQLPRDPNEKAVETPDDMTLFLLIGQSNMAGRAKVPDEDRQPLPRAYKLNRDDVWVPATAPFHFDRKSAGMGPANEFVKRYLADHPNETVGIVPCAVGGSQSATWDAHGEGKVGANFRRALARAKAAKGKGRFAAILWHQGESDAGASVEDLKRYYPKRFAEMIAAFRREIGDVPVVAGEIGWFMTEEAAKVNPVLNGLPDVVPNCRCVTSKGLKNQDRWHFDLPSARTLGQRYYAAFRDLQNPARLVSVTSTADGTPQPAWFWTPQTAEKKPLLVELHSWSYGCTTDGQPHAKFLDRCRKAGWAHVLPNFRGPNETPPACGSDLAVQDVMDAVAYARAHAAIDEDRIYLAGSSGGGMMTLLMAGRHPDVWAACYAACPISDIARWHAETSAFADWRKKYAGMMEKCCGGKPDAKPEEYARRSPLTYLAAARRQGTVIDICEGIHDGHTGSVPVGHSFRAFNALADEKDRISEADIATFERTEKTPAALAGEWRDPYFTDKLRIHFRRTSANVRLTIFEGGHAGNLSAGFEWLGRQRRGKSADWAVAAQGVGTEDVSTK